VEEFDDWYQERLHRTIDVPVPDRDKNAKPTQPVRVFQSLGEILGYDASDRDLLQEITDESSLGAEEAELLQRYERGEISEEDLATFGI
jgi:hypothetical protein